MSAPRPTEHPGPRKRRRAFEVKVVPDDDRVMVTPVGELDMATADEVWDTFEQLRQASADRIVLDLREITFMDSTGLHVIVKASGAASRDGFDFALIDGTEPVCRILDLTGLREHLPFTRP